MGIRCLVNKMLKIISGLLVLRLIARAEQRETDTEIGVRIIRLLSQDLLKLDDRLVRRS